MQTLLPLNPIRVSACAGQPNSLVVAPESKVRWRALFSIPALIFVMRFTPGWVGEASYLLTAVYALMGRRQAVTALLIVSLLNNITHEFGAPPEFATFTRYAVLFAAMLSVFVFNRGGVVRKQFSTPLLCATGIVLLLLLHSVMFSTLPLLSALKAFSFGVAVLSLFVACAGMSPPQRRDLELQVLGIVSGVLLLSVPLIFSGAGYYREVAGFAGLIKHPQALGVIASLCGVVVWMNVLTQNKLRYSFFVIGIVAVVETFLTRARVGGLVLAGGIAAGFALPMFSASWSRLRGKPTILARRVVPFLIIGLVAVTISGPQLLSALNKYALKYSGEDSGKSALEAIQESREMLIRPMLKNLEQHPLTGVGFGVPGEGDKSGGVVTDPIFGLPIMAAIEKGFLPIAIFEELGYPLGTLIYLWIGSLMLLAMRGGAVSTGVAVGALLINLGESVFFAAGGLGMYLWVFLCLAMTATAFDGPNSRRSLF